MPRIFMLMLIVSHNSSFQFMYIRLLTTYIPSIFSVLWTHLLATGASIGLGLLWHSVSSQILKSRPNVHYLCTAATKRRTLRVSLAFSNIKPGWAVFDRRVLLQLTQSTQSIKQRNKFIHHQYMFLSTTANPAMAAWLKRAAHLGSHGRRADSSRVLSIPAPFLVTASATAPHVANSPYREVNK